MPVAPRTDKDRLVATAPPRKNLRRAISTIRSTRNIRTERSTKSTKSIRNIKNTKRSTKSTLQEVGAEIDITITELELMKRESILAFSLHHLDNLTLIHFLALVAKR